MSLSKFYKIKASLVFVFIFGAFTFFLGFVYNQLPKTLSDRDKQLISLIGAPTLVLAFLALINSTVSQEIESEIKSKKRELKDESDETLNLEMKDFMELYQDDTKNLKTAIESLDFSDKRDNLLRLITSLELAEQKFKAKRKAAEEIAKWLDIKENKSYLFKAAQNAVSKAKCNIPKKYKPKFDQDIRQCINWLYDSVLKRTGCEVESRHASAIVNLPEKYRPYEIALRAIEKYLEEQQELKPYYANSTVVKKMMDYLIKELKIK
jgi:hypothetical protein